jgi:pyruvate,water dikinase
MNLYVHSLTETNKLNISAAGGKGFNLVELSKIESILIPEGFCVTTEAFKKTFVKNNEFNLLIDQLSNLNEEDKDKINSILCRRSF